MTVRYGYDFSSLITIWFEFHIKSLCRSERGVMTLAQDIKYAAQQCGRQPSEMCSPNGHVLIRVLSGSERGSGWERANFLRLNKINEDQSWKSNIKPVCLLFIYYCWAKTTDNNWQPTYWYTDHIVVSMVVSHLHSSHCGVILLWRHHGCPAE